MIRGQSQTAPRVLSIVTVLLALLLSALAGRYLVLQGLSYREVIVVLVALIGVIAVLAGERGVRVGFILWVFTLGLGYRTVEVTSKLRIHPSEVLLWALLILLMIQWGILRRKKLEVRLPPWLTFFIPFWAWGWALGLLSGRSWDLIVHHFRGFLLLLPLFMVTAVLLKDRTNWRPVILSFYAVSTWIAVMGFAEYVFPGIRTLAPDFFGDVSPTLTTEGFVRAEFSFFGGPTATFICVLAMPMAAILWHWWSSPLQRLFILFALGVQVVGIYIGGFRSAWLLLGLVFLLGMLLRRGPILAGLTLLPTLAGYWLLPGAVQQRVYSMILALQGQPIDSSAAERWERTADALAKALQRPWGWGWAGTGWVHNDFLVVAAQLGLVAGLLFAGAYLMTLWRMWSRVRQYASDDERGILGFALLLSLVAVGGILGTHPIAVLPQLALPVWLMWVLAEIWMRQQQAPHGTAER
jgi:hypothetical protein